MNRIAFFEAYLTPSDWLIVNVLDQIIALIGWMVKLDFKPILSYNILTIESFAGIV